MKKFYSMNWIAGLACSVLMFGTVACNNGGGSSSPGILSPYGSVAGITNPVAIYNTIASSSYYGDTQMVMSLIGQGGGMQSGYNQQVGFQGTLTLTGANNNISFCGAPAGTYALSTTQTGVMSGTSIGPMQIMATGPVTLTMSVSYGIIEYAGSRVSFNMNVSVNGQPCGQLITL